MDIIIAGAVIGAIIMIFRLIFRKTQLEKDDFSDLCLAENKETEPFGQTNERLDREIDELIKQYHKEDTLPITILPDDTQKYDSSQKPDAAHAPQSMQAPTAKMSYDSSALKKEIEDLDRRAAEKAVEAEDIYDEIRRVQQQLKELKKQARRHEDDAEALKRESAAKKEQLHDTEQMTYLS